MMRWVNDHNTVANIQHFMKRLGWFRFQTATNGWPQIEFNKIWSVVGKVLAFQSQVLGSNPVRYGRIFSHDKKTTPLPKSRYDT